MIQEAPAVRTESSQWHDAYGDEKLVRRRATSHRKKLGRLGIFALPLDARILDVACGTGEALEILRARGFRDLTGVDVTVDPRLKDQPWVTLQEADACALPHDTATFDVVLSMHSLHHLGGVIRLGRGLEEWRRVLRPGGRLMLIDHYDSPQLRAAFWGLQKPWLTWPTRGLKCFGQQLREEQSYLYEYLDAWHAVRVLIDGLGLEVEIDRRGLFFFYWSGRKRS